MTEGSAVFNYSVRPAIKKDIIPIVRNMRYEDIREVTAFGNSPAFSLGFGFQVSKPCLTVTVEGKPVAMFGAVPLGDGVTAVVWLLGTDAISKPVNRIRFVRESRKWLDYLFAKYSKLTNLVDSRNKLHISWLKWMGFVVVETRQINGIDFHQVEKEISDV